MCGRTCLTLEESDIKCACKYTQSKSKTDFQTPEWRSEFNFGKKFQPSYNVAPSDITPVLISSDHFRDKENDKSEENFNRILVPMMWGMVPFWHKGDYKRHGLTTNNCRLEHLLESKLYSRPFRKGQRCVIICEGFYEWQTTKSVKPSERSAYMLYMPQAKDIKIYDKSTWKKNEDINLLKLAGLFDIWEDESGDKIFSYSVITFESCEWMSWLHHRMPAILETEEQVADWIDFRRISDKDALNVLKPSQKLSWHEVSNLVNNSRNKSGQCNKPIADVKVNNKRNSAESTLLKSWLIRQPKENVKNKLHSDSDEENNQKIKRPKLSIPSIKDEH